MTGQVDPPTERRHAEGVLLLAGAVALLVASVLATFPALNHMTYSCGDSYDRRVTVLWACVATLLLVAAYLFVWRGHRRSPQGYIALAQILAAIVFLFLVLVWVVAVFGTQGCG